MKKIIKLIENIEYDRKYLEQQDKEGNIQYRDTDSYTFKSLSLERVTYTSDDIVNIDDRLLKVADEITENFKTTFINRGKAATEEQIYFATETAKVVLGEFKSNIIAIAPAPCGFGKSTIKLEIMKYLTKLYNNESTDGVIIVGDRLADLKQLQEDLGEDKKYTFLLESWNEDVCLDSSKKVSQFKICKNCDFSKCKIKIQSYKQQEYPILLITNARLKEFGQAINQYKQWEKGERKILLIDERPQIMDTVKVNKELLNEIDTYISNLTYDDMKDKTELSSYWKEIKEIVENKMIPLREHYKRFIISNNSDTNGVCKNNEEFMKLWSKYMKHDYSKELTSIHTVLTKGGFYVCETNKEFISTIGVKNLREDYKGFQTIIFDGSALYDPQYTALYDEDEEKSDLKFLYIPNTRTYENLNITAYLAHKISKTEFKNKTYLNKAISEFIKNKSKVGFGYDYVVTYKEQSSMLGNLLGDSLKSKIPKKDNGQCYYFGGTKGSNEMEKCTRMFQIGWDTMPDYEYAIMWLSCKKGLWDKLLEITSNMDKAIDYSEMLQKADRDEMTLSKRKYSSGRKNYCFGFDEIDRFQYLDIVSKFYQEIHRTKLRDYSYEGDLKVYVFQVKSLIYEMINSLLPRCDFLTNKDNLIEFISAQTDDRKPTNGKEKTNPQILKQCLESYLEGTIIKMSDIITKSELTRKQIDSIRDKNKGNKWCIEWFETHKTDKRGIYKI